MDNCSCCFTDYLAKCEDEIKLNIVLPAYMNYKWVITDKFGNKYEGALSEDFTIPVSDLPAGLLTQYSGDFKLQIYPDTNEACAPVQFLIAGMFDCIDFSIKGGTFAKTNLGCEV